MSIIFFSRSCVPVSRSSAHRGSKPSAITAKTIASKRGRYDASNGQLIKTAVTEDELYFRIGLADGCTVSGARASHRKDDSIEKRTIRRVERTIDKDSGHRG